MRAITGKYKGRHFDVPSNFKARPTTDFAKENIFNVLRGRVDFEGLQVLDLFAGSGQLGIEALSRDAAFCTFVDKNRDSYELVKANLAHCKLTELARVENSDSLNFLKLTPQKFDIALLDPPYRQGLIDKAMPLLDRVMNPGAVVVCEHEREFLAAGEYGSLKLRKRYRYGKIMLSVYDKSGLEE